MQAIIRFSLNNDKSSVLRNRLKAALEDGGFMWDSTTTATYRHQNTTSKALSTTLGAFWQIVNAYKGKADFDHFWMYCDNPPPLENLPADLAHLAAPEEN